MTSFFFNVTRIVMVWDCKNEEILSDKFIIAQDDFPVRKVEGKSSFHEITALHVLFYYFNRIWATLIPTTL